MYLSDRIGWFQNKKISFSFPAFQEEDDLLGTFNKQIEEDRRIIISRSNLIELHKVCIFEFHSSLGIRQQLGNSGFFHVMDLKKLDFAIGFNL